MIGVVFMIVVWIRDNIPDRTDIGLAEGRRRFPGAKHPAAGRFNAGQKAIFWAVALGGVALSVTGIIMLFPFGSPASPACSSISTACSWRNTSTPSSA